MSKNGKTWAEFKEEYRAMTKGERRTVKKQIAIWCAYVLIPVIIGLFIFLTGAAD